MEVEAACQIYLVYRVCNQEYEGRCVGLARAYLLLFREFPIDKTSVKRGENSPEVVTATRCVNVGLFLSNDLRRDVTVSFGISDGAEWKIISFPGETLKRVSPDERSIAFFLLKAYEKLDSLSDNTIYTMDNGIVVQRIEPEQLLSAWEGNIYLARNGNADELKMGDRENSLYIYDIDTRMEIDDPKFEVVTRPRTPERFIVDINMIYDSRE